MTATSTASWNDSTWEEKTHFFVTQHHSAETLGHFVMSFAKPATHLVPNAAKTSIYILKSTAVTVDEPSQKETKEQQQQLTKK